MNLRKNKQLHISAGRSDRLCGCGASGGVVFAHGRDGGVGGGAGGGGELAGGDRGREVAVNC